MNRPIGKRLLALLSVIVLIALAMCMRYFTISGALPSQFSSLRNIIHIALLTSWGISLHMRIIQAQARRYLLAVAALMAVWLLLKIVNYSIDNIVINRYLWYLYYIPMLFIPTIALFISMSLGRAEDYRLPQRSKLLCIPTGLLLLLVLTNDLHRHVFSFPSGVLTPRDYLHEAGYYIVLGWIMLCALASLAIMVTKCRIPRSRKIMVLPLIPLALSFAYTAAYIRGFRPVLLLAGDMTVTHCLLIAAMFEGCIQCGLIQSNIGYNEMFASTTLPVQITDAAFCAQNTSAAMRQPMPQDYLRQMTADVVSVDGDTLLKRHALHDGWVFWEEDISELNRINEELELTRDELRDTGSILAAENAQREKYLRLSEENHLYDMMETQTSRQIKMLRDRLAEIRTTADPDRARSLLGQAIIIGTYIKRRNNLIFVGTHCGMISAQELRLCFNESIESLILYGVKCRALIDGDSLLAMEQAAQIYDLFEAVVEAGLESLESLLISVEIRDWVEINICVSCKGSLCGLKGRFPALEWTQDEDGLQYFTQKAGKMGAKAYEQNQGEL